jgi:thiamine biosynthesis protein ThiS
VLVDTIEVRINGQSARIPTQLDVAAVLKHIGVAVDRVAVELNCAIVRKRDWTSTLVTAGSQLEIVEFVGGG